MAVERPEHLSPHRDADRQACIIIAIVGALASMLIVACGFSIWLLVPKIHPSPTPQVIQPVATEIEAQPTSRPFSTGNFYLIWSQLNPEEVIELRWNGSGNLVSTFHNPECSGDLEFFGNSWVSEHEGTSAFFFGSLVGYGMKGTRTNEGTSQISIESISVGCPTSVAIRVHTSYSFFDDPKANIIKVERTFEFGDVPFSHDVRPFIPRLYPREQFSQVLYPSANGEELVTHTLAGCGYGCSISDWDGTWFAIHAPQTGIGMVVQHEDAGVPAALWLDEDGGSRTNSSSVLLLRPPVGFRGNMTETEYLCFYDRSIWTPSLTLPSGCQP